MSAPIPNQDGSIPKQWVAATPDHSKVRQTTLSFKAKKGGIASEKTHRVSSEVFFSSQTEAKPLKSAMKNSINPRMEQEFRNVAEGKTHNISTPRFNIAEANQELNSFQERIKRKLPKKTSVRFDLTEEGLKHKEEQPYRYGFKEKVDPHTNEKVLKMKEYEDVLREKSLNKGSVEDFIKGLDQSQRKVTPENLMVAFEKQLKKSYQAKFSHEKTALKFVLGVFSDVVGQLQKNMSVEEFRTALIKEIDAKNTQEVKIDSGTRKDLFSKGKMPDDIPREVYRQHRTLEEGATIKYTDTMLPQDIREDIEKAIDGILKNPSFKNLLEKLFQNKL